MAKTKFKGLTIREGGDRAPKFVITFTYRGVQCRETLQVPVTPANEKYATRLLSEIQLKIDRGDFRYADYFPKSPKCKIFGVTATVATVREYVENYIALCERRGVEASTIKSYRSNLRSLSDFHNIAVRDLTPAMVRDWILRQTISQKSIRNRLSVLRPALDDAIMDGLLQQNPLRIINASKYIKETSAKTRDPVDPFAPDEVERVLSAAKSRSELEYCLFLFAFETGMRTGELIALEWADVDWQRKTVHVTKSIVEREEKAPKTEAGKRVIELSEKALESLMLLKPFTMLMGDTVFLNPLTMERWTTSDQIRKTSWMHILRMAKVRYRKPYNTRHTFATKHISTNANIWWLAKQMGHRSPEMLFKHYGTFIKEYGDSAQKDLAGTPKRLGNAP